MSAVDFEQWAVPDLVLTLRGRTYTVRPPSVEDGKKVIAAAVRGEVELGLVDQPLPEEVQRVLDSIGPDDHPALGAAFAEMLGAGLDQATIDRAGYYAVFYWARGKEYADSLATILFTPRDPDAPTGGDARPKVSRRRRTGRRTA